MNQSLFAAFGGLETVKDTLLGSHERPIKSLLFQSGAVLSVKFLKMPADSMDHNLDPKRLLWDMLKHGLVLNIRQLRQQQW